MPTESEYQDLLDRLGAFRQELTRRRAADLIGTPQLGEALLAQVDQMLHQLTEQQDAQPPPPDLGLAQLAGIGDEAASRLGETRIPNGVAPYDDTVTSERMIAVGDLYYIYQHERLGLFRAVRKLQELFRAGTVRLSSGSGAYGLYKFDRRDVLRYTQADRLAAYRRVLGYGAGPTPLGARPNAEFHRLFQHFANQVTLYWRDKRISDVIRERSFDPSFGSIAIVRRAGLDLRNNLKFASFGHLNVMRVEVMQVLDEAYRILGADDIRQLFGADNAWDVVEEVLLRYFNQRLVTSPRQRMGVTGREILRWLAQPFILQTARAQFETLLLQISEATEEWTTSAESLGEARRTSNAQRVMPVAATRGPRRPVTPAIVAAR